ncbi:MAG: ATP-binding protein, partial [Chloroflexi bacterium]|nr:ATP-binding protein [Chloroflexota bacterium]
MSDGERISDELDAIYGHWGLSGNPFSESASTLSQARLRQVFTGRERELRKVLSLFRSLDRQRLLIYGWVGIGKTAFIFEVLSVVTRRATDTLVAYITLPSTADLATAALIALARQMEGDEWAQHQLNQMGLRPRQPTVESKTTLKGGVLGFGGQSEERSVPVIPPRFPTLSFEDLLERALHKYRRVMVVIDDLDKLD